MLIASVPPFCMQLHCMCQKTIVCPFLQELMMFYELKPMPSEFRANFSSSVSHRRLLHGFEWCHFRISHCDYDRCFSGVTSDA